MKAKLIKKDDHYFLEVEPYTLSTLQKHTIIANTFDKPKGDILQLSLKNCQAIERGYDLDELADEYCTHEPKNAKELRDVNLVKLGFRDGFQKALELMGDKKFSKGDIAYIMNMMQIYHGLSFDEAITKFESLQQTEWNVIVEMEESHEYEMCSNPKDHTSCLIPKLDADGCLILKEYDREGK